MGPDVTMIGNRCFAKHNPEPLLDYVSGRLPAESRARVESHAAACESCQSWLAAQGEVWTALDSFEGPVVSSDFDRRLYARIEAERSRRGWKAFWNRWFESGEPWPWKPVAAVSLALMIAVGTLAVRTADPGAAPAPAPALIAEQSAAAESPDLEQVERTLEDLELLETASVL